MAAPTFAGNMLSYKTNDGVTIKYIDTSVHDLRAKEKEILMMIHGFTGSSAVWQRNILALSATYRIIAPDLRGHGTSDKASHGFHVARLAMDLKELLAVLGVDGDGNRKGEEKEESEIRKGVRAMGGSLGCAVLWSYTTLFTSTPFTHLLFIDQSPLQNLSPYNSITIPTWSPPYSHLLLNTPAVLSSLQSTLLTEPSTAHLGTITSCLGYRAFPKDTDRVKAGSKEADEDEKFFLNEALKGDGAWLGKLMADHTALDWREGIRAGLGRESGSLTRVMVLTSSRSGCFSPSGPLHVVDLINAAPISPSSTTTAMPQPSTPVFASQSQSPTQAPIPSPTLSKQHPPFAKGAVVDWGGHWMYWEEPEKFNELALEFFSE